MTDNQARTILLDWWNHMGYTEEEFATAENDSCSKAGCEFVGGVGYVGHEDMGGYSLHPLMDQLSGAAELVMFVLEHPTLAAMRAAPTQIGPLDR